jgi:signal transduction histidine kinase
MGAWELNIEENTVISDEQFDILLGLSPSPDKKSVFFLLGLVHPDDSEKVASLLQKAAETKRMFHAECRIIRADDGEVRWLSGYGRMINEKDNKATRMVGVAYDITPHKTLEQQKDDFISIASHELKTPVTSIKIYSELLHERSQTNNEGEEHILIGKLNGQVDRLTDLIGDLLDTSTISEDKLLLNSEKFDMKELIEAHIEEHQHTTDKHKIILHSCDTTQVIADKERIGQVISNFISNAIKYSPQEGEITISCELAENGIKVSVRDRGIGIPEEVKEKVFDRFFRVNNPEMRTYPGMGLGLYISAGIIRRHGGIIDVESNLGEGTVFYFILPYNGLSKNSPG